MDSRAELLRRGEELRDEARKCKAAGDFDGEMKAHRQREALMRQYTKSLSVVAVARCPDTGVLAQCPIDTGDFGGWFWDYDNPWREYAPMPSTWLTMCGAVRLHEPIAFAKFWCQPGPGVPYVIPRILSGEGVRAVINQLSVGTHTAWTISYCGSRHWDVIPYRDLPGEQLKANIFRGDVRRSR